MAKVNKIDSNVTGLRYAEEDSLGVVSGSAKWTPLEPNGYSDFGGSITTVARNPINPSRQRKKGVVTDLEANGGFGTDLTQTNLQDILQGFMFADLRKKIELDVADVTNAASDYQPVSGGADYNVDDLLFAKGFSDNAANGLKTVVSGAASSVVVVETLPDLTGETGVISKVGFEFAAGDAVIDVAGNFPALTTTVKDLTELGLIAGEWIFIGGDATLNQFDTETENGFARVRAIATNRIDFDKTSSVMLANTGTGKEIQVFSGRVLKNELGALIKRRSYQLERTLGAADDSQPSQIQSEYVVGAVANELSVNIPSAEKVTFDLSFVGINSEQRDGVTGVKAGTRPSLEEADAFNTSSDFSRIKLAVVDDINAAPTPLFAFAQDLTLTISNNVTPNKAVGTLGAFEVTAGTFTVSGSMTAYFADVNAISAVTNNDDITFDTHLVKANSGITIDVPLISLGDGRPSIEQDSPITLPLNIEAATAAKIDSNLDYTLLMVFWDYLPDAADV